MVTQEAQETQQPPDARDGEATEVVQRDIYELLGIDHRASALLAQDIYWRRVNAFLDADRAGDPEARANIEELNAALTIIMDEERRAEYDHEHGYDRLPREAQAFTNYEPSRIESRARWRSLAVVALIPIVGVAMWLALPAGTFVAVGVGVLGVAALLLAAHWANQGIVEGMSPFRVLRLREGAPLEDVQAAYQAEVGQLLIRARRDRRAIRQLEALDRAYLSASAILASGESGKPPSLPAVWTGRLGRVLVPLVRGGGAAVASLAMVLLRGAKALTRRAGRAMGAAGAAGWTSATSRTPDAGDDPEMARRLAARLGEVTERVATVPLVGSLGEPTWPDATPASTGGAAPSGAAANGVAASGVRASLVLESAAGRRNVPVSAVPLRIGSDGACDLVLRQDGVMPEHAIAWLREDAVVLHVIHQGAVCLVNGEPMTWAVLEDGDVVEFGEATVGLSIK